MDRVSRHLATRMTCHIAVIFKSNYSLQSKVYQNHQPEPGSIMKQSQQRLRDLPFSEMMHSRLSEASRSVCIQMQSAHEVHSVYEACTHYGFVNGLYLNSTGTGTYALVEFGNNKAAENFVSSASFFAREDQVPLRSKFLFRVGRIYRSGWHGYRNRAPIVSEASESELNDSLKQCQSVSDQISKLAEFTRLSEVGLRTRFFMADALQASIRQALPFVSFTPFGSTVNSLGTRNSDLDVNMTLEPAETERASGQGIGENEFRYLTVTFDSDRRESERLLVSRLVEFVGTYARLIVPKCADVHVIRKARVPLVHFRNVLTGVSVDLSARNEDAINMGELLYNIGWLEPRFTTLALTLKRFAKAQRLTVDHPSPQLTGFMLVSMLIHYLQTRPVPLLCPLRVLIRPVDADFSQSLSRVFPAKKDPKLEGDNVSNNGSNNNNANDTPSGDSSNNVEIANSKFMPRSQRKLLRNVQASLRSKPNLESLENLLIGFLRYFAAFDYDHSAIDLFDGTLIENAFGKPFVLLNPLDHNHIVTQALTAQHIEQIRTVFTAAADQLEKFARPGVDDANFGLIRILTLLEAAQTLSSTVATVAAPNANLGENALPQSTALKAERDGGKTISKSPS